MEMACSGGRNDGSYQRKRTERHIRRLNGDAAMSVASTGTADLDVASVAEIAETLRRLLADVFALYLKTRELEQERRRSVR